MTFRRKHARQFGAYSRRGTGNQRHTLSHDSMLLKLLCNDVAPGICSRPQALGGMQAVRKHTAIIKMRGRSNYSRPPAVFASI